MKRRILTVVLAIFVLQAQFAFAAQKEVTREYTFVTDKDAELTFADVGKGDLSDIPLTIEASGKRYQAADAEFSLAKEPEKVKETYEDLTAKDVPESIEKDGEIIVRTLSPAAIEVVDNGKGISKEVEAKLFSPFFSTKPNGQGIGLIFIREVLMRHGCTFSLRTYADGLTRFRILFP